MTRVFKYRGGDDLVVKRDLRSLYKNEIYAAPFSSLNDPLEATVILDQQSFEFGSLILNRAIGVKLEQALKANAKLKVAVEKFILFTKNIGVYSLSQTETDELLWAHYANSHQGFCLEYSLDELMSYQLEGETLLEVDYKDAPPILSLMNLDSEQTYKQLVATKSKSWEYEREIRACVGSSGIREYDFRALKAVYFGVRCSSRIIRITMRLLRGRKLKYYQMQLVEGSYKLEPVPIDDRYIGATPYRERVAPIAEDVPYLDEKIMPYEREIRAAIEIARRDPYCERVCDAYLSGQKGTYDNPVFYVTYDRSDGLPRILYYSAEEIREHELYT